MKWLAVILLSAVFVRHNSAFWMASALDTTPAAMSYFMGGVLEAVAGAALAILFFVHRRSLWRNLGIFAGIVMMSEGFQMAACRLAVDIKTLPPNTTLCDHATGLPVGSVLATLYLLAFGFILARR